MDTSTGPVRSDRDAGGREVFRVPAVDSGDDALIDLFAAIMRTASEARDALIVGDTSLLPEAVGRSTSAVHALLRAQLLCRRGGSRLELSGSSPELRETITLLGVGDALPEHRPEPAARG